MNTDLLEVAAKAIAAHVAAPYKAQIAGMEERIKVLSINSEAPTAAVDELNRIIIRETDAKRKAEAEANELR